MSRQFGWVIKWAPVGIPNDADRQDGPYKTASHIYIYIYLQMINRSLKEFDV